MSGVNKGRSRKLENSRKKTANGFFVGENRRKGATEKSVTPSCHTEREDEPIYFAFFSSSLSGSAPLLLTDFLTVMSMGVAASP